MHCDSVSDATNRGNNESQPYRAALREERSVRIPPLSSRNPTLLKLVLWNFTLARATPALDH
jgi:hypothetical protein